MITTSGARACQARPSTRGRARTKLASAAVSVRRPARVSTIEKERSSLRAVLAADIIATPADPLADITALCRVAFVMKDGKVIRKP